MMIQADLKPAEAVVFRRLVAAYKASKLAFSNEYQAKQLFLAESLLDVLVEMRSYNDEDSETKALVALVYRAVALEGAK